MRSDVHFAALRAAAKVAFSLSLLNGCSNADVASEKNVEGDEGSASNDSALSSAARASVAEDCPNRPPSCASVLASAFPKPGDYQWEPVPQPANVVACCDAELTKHDAMTPYRWDCCVAFDPKDPDGKPLSHGEHAMACTPWGPPVPPSMDRDRLAKRRAQRAAALIAMAVA